MTPTEVLMKQIASFQAAIATLQAAIDDITSSVDPEEATWNDVARHALLADRVKAAGLDDEPGSCP
jgi:tetrahydromethanopterin S-methyltransferase subunit B